MERKMTIALSAKSTVLWKIQIETRALSFESVKMYVLCSMLDARKTVNKLVSIYLFAIFSQFYFELFNRRIL